MSDRGPSMAFEAACVQVGTLGLVAQPLRTVERISTSEFCDWLRSFAGDDSSGVCVWKCFVMLKFTQGIKALHIKCA